MLMMIKQLDLNIMYFNCNSLINKLEEFKNFLSEKEIGVGCLSETFLKSNHAINLKNYTMIRKDDSNTVRGGGVALVVHKDIDFIELKVPTLKTIPSVCAIKVRCMNDEDIVIASIYIQNSIKKIDSRDLALIMSTQEQY